MKTKNTVIGALIGMTQSKWVQPALVMVVILGAVLGATGCSPHH